MSEGPASTKKLKADPLRILLADDHSLIREGLKALISAQPDMTIIREAEDGEEAVRQAIDCQPDIVIMDVSMPRLGGAEATAQICQTCRKTQILALTMHEDASYLRSLLDAGAAGYVLKRSASQELIQAIRHVASGKTYLDPAVAGKVATAFVQKSQRSEAAGSALSTREEAAIKLVAQGYTNREIGEQLSLSIKTAESYKARAMEKLGLSSRADLVRYAAASGWFDQG